MADPGTHADVYNTLASRLLAFFISCVGILFMTIIIGFVVEGIAEKMEALKKGKGSVIESDHTVVLGYTSFTVEFIQEICDANSSEGGGVVVVLDDQEKEEMEKVPPMHAVYKLRSQGLTKCSAHRISSCK
jgi:hypothetical protein